MLHLFNAQALACMRVVFHAAAFLLQGQHIFRIVYVATRPECRAYLLLVIPTECCETLLKAILQKQEAIRGAGKNKFGIVLTPSWKRRE